MWDEKLARQSSEKGNTLKASKRQRRVVVQSRTKFLLPPPLNKNTHRLSGSVATSAAPARPSAPRPTTAVLIPPAATAASPKSPKTPRGGAGPRRFKGAAVNDVRRAAAGDETTRAVPAMDDGDDVRLPRIVSIFFLKSKKKRKKKREEGKRRKRQIVRRERKKNSEFFRNQAVASAGLAQCCSPRRGWPAA